MNLLEAFRGFRQFLLVEKREKYLRVRQIGRHIDTDGSQRSAAD